MSIKLTVLWALSDLAFSALAFSALAFAFFSSFSFFILLYKVGTGFSSYGKLLKEDTENDELVL